MKWNSLFKRRRFERRMETEFRFHLDSQINDYIAQGMSREEAESRARREFGPVELAKDECRDERPVELLDHVLRDVRYAARGLRKSPGFAAASVVTFALGIGANTAILNAVYAVLLKPLPYSHPEQIYSVEVVIPQWHDQLPSLPVRVQDYLESRHADTVFSTVAALTPAEWNVTGSGEPEHVGGAQVSSNFFSFLGVPVSRGRGFLPEEEQPGKDKVVVISDGFWRRRYGSDPGVIGKTINLNGEDHIVVGIAARSLLVPTGSQLHPALSFAPRIDVWKPIAPTNKELQGESWNHGELVRLRPGESLERGRQQLQAIRNASIRAQVPDLKIDLITRLVPIREIYSGKARLGLLLILGASGLLLVVGCTNIANLFLARMASRATEFATRIALGASRARIVGQVLIESTLLATIGGAIGTFAGYFGGSLLAAYGPDDTRLMFDSRLHLPVLVFAAVASMITGFVCGAFPAWQAYRKDTGSDLQEGARMSFGGGRAARFRQVLVGVEIALGTALLASASLLLHSFVKVMHADRGYEVERVLAVDLGLSGPGYASSGKRSRFYNNLAETIRRLPGVLAAGAVSDLPAIGASATQAVFYSTDTNQNVVLQRPVARIRSVTSGYFAASATALRAGRFPSEQDQMQVGVISESLARRLWPGEALERAVGRAIRNGDASGPLITICGVVQDVRSGAVDQELPFQVYRPHRQRATERMTMVVRTSQEPTSLSSAIRVEIRKMDENLPIPAIRTMREIMFASVAQRRFQMVLTSLFATLGLLLGAVGVYGVVSYAVACRTRDIGIRMALGAINTDVMRWVFSQGMQPVLIGLLVGLGGAIAVATEMRSLLFEITPTDPASLGGVVLILLFTASLACYLPARRVARLDPVTALRHE
jgi:putative ABC transport system permease protein